MQVRFARHAILAIWGASAVCAPIASAADPQPHCDTLETLVHAAQDEPAFSSLAPELSTGRRVGRFAADPALGRKEGARCSILAAPGRYPVLTCGLPLIEGAEKLDRFVMANRSHQFQTDRFASCPLLSDIEPETSGVQTARWELTDSKVQVRIQAVYPRDKSLPPAIALKVQHDIAIPKT